MYGNNPFIIPNTVNPIIPPLGNMMRTPPVMNTMMRNTPMLGNITSRGGLSSLFGLGRQTGNLLTTRSFNLGNFLNGASKTLGVVKEAIPIVKEIGPMIGNMKQMMKIASIFKDETETSNNHISEKNNINETKKENDTPNNSIIQNLQTNENEPNFFI